MTAIVMPGRSWLPAAVAMGALLGFVYTLSPLTVLSAAALWPLWLWVSRGCSRRERQWLAAVLVLGVASRALIIAALFLAADPARPFATFFGDEEFFLNRTLWLRNLGFGLSVAPSDVIYLFDEVGQTSYVRWLALVQALVGPAPYGVHLFNALQYLVAAAMLYRLVRQGFGGVAALGGLIVLLFLPSLFAWSVSALKEPSYLLLGAVGVTCTVQIVRASRWWHRAAAVGGVMACGVLLDGLRTGGLVFAIFGSVIGLLTWFIVSRPRLLLATVCLLPVIVAVSLSRPAVSDRVLSVVREAAAYHSGHIVTPGATYRLLEPRYYGDRVLIASMPADEAARFVVRALVSYFVVPAPWAIETPLMLAFLPEQMFWYALALLAIAGVVAGWRLDPLLTSVIAAHAAAAILIVALTSGNVGTLVRHRGLALPYVVWLSTLGACDLLRRAVRPVERDFSREPSYERG